MSGLRHHELPFTPCGGVELAPTGHHILWPKQCEMLPNMILSDFKIVELTLSCDHSKSM